MGKSTSHSSGNRSYIIAYDFSSDRLRRKVEKTLSTLTLLLADIEILSLIQELQKGTEKYVRS